jgi:hypothetical protein
LGKATAGQFQASQEHQKDAQQMPDENDEIQRPSAQTRGEGNQIRGQHAMGLGEKEYGIVGIQSGLEMFFDGGQVDGAILVAEMIAVHQN